MLAGAYSTLYKTAEREQVDHLKSVKQEEKVDVIARTRRLTQETNKRRKAQAQKRKHELQREEKRRQYILSKRREEQQRATEKYQRAHVPSSRPGSRKSSPTRTTTGLEEALKLIRGTPPLSRQNSHSSTGGHRSRQSPRGYRTNSYDPLNRPYFNKYSSRHLRPQSPAERAQEHAEMLDKSLRNYTDSRSLFEQQLEQHQQLLLEEQKKSLHNFNQAIQLEMEADAKLEGTEEMVEDSPWLTRSDSLTSVDSLEASNESLVKDRPVTAKITGDATSNSKSYPRPVPPKATPLVGRVAPNSASVTTINDSLETSSKPFQVDYSSRTSTTNYGSGAIIGPIMNNRVSEQPFLLHAQPQVHEQNPIQDFQDHQQVMADQIGNAVNTLSYLTTDTTQFSSYTSPQNTYSMPTNATIAQGSEIMAAGQPTSQTLSLPPSVSSQTVSQASTLPSSVSGGSTLPQSQNPVWDSSKQTTVSTLSFTSVSSPSYTSQAPVTQQSLPQATVGGPATTNITNPTPVTVSHKTSGLTTTTSYLSSAARPTPTVTAEKHKVESTPPPGSKTADKGSIMNGTLGLVHGKLAVLADIEAVARGNQPPVEQGAQRRALSQRSASDLEPKEVKGILKRPETGKLRKVMSTGNLQKTGLNVKDSIEVARGLQKAENIRRKSGKKSVRFADLHYEDDIPEDTDSVDSNTDLATPVKKVNINQKAAVQGTPNGIQRQRPVSAKVSGSNRVASARTRAASAGYSRPGQPQHAQDRPRAAAHIIAHSVEGNDYLSGNPDKKVTVITNNFMGKVPSNSKSSTANASQGVIYTSSNAYTDHNGDIQVSNTSVLQKAESVASAYQNKYVAAQISSQLPHDASSQKKNQEVYNENGLRIDRTPTDDEINWLWDKVRTCLNREPTAMEKKTTASLAATDPNLNLSRQAAPVSNKYIDGASLGLTGTSRVAPAMYGNTVQQRAMNNMSTRQKPGSANTGSYMRKYGLLQQRKQQTDSAKRSTQHYNPTVSKLEPQETSPVARSDITESMANFLAAEHFAGRSLSESQVQLAMEEAHQRQMEIRAEGGNRATAGPSALSLEEQKLMESLDRLNDKLKISESKHPPVDTSKPATVQHYVHSGGFRGRQPFSQPQQRGRPFNSSGLRVQSARHCR